MKHPIFKSSSDNKSVIQGLILLMGLWYSTVSFSSPEMNKIGTGHCEEITAAYANNQDAEIQSQLRQIFKDNSCFKKDMNKKGKPLSDGDVGPLTKVWISKYLSSQISDEKTNALANPEDGIRPFVLTEDDVTYFAINADVLDVLKAQQGKTYISQSVLLDEVKTELAEVEGMTDTLLVDYVNQLSKFIEPVQQKSLTSGTIGLLMANNKVFAANALKSQVDKPVNREDFNKVIKNMLVSAYLSESKDQKLSDEQKNEINKSIKIINSSAKASDLYKFKYNDLDKQKFPSIDKDITDCARNYINIPFPGEQAIRQALTSMLSKLTRLKNKEFVYNFSCTVTEDDSVVVTEVEQKTPSKTVNKKPKTEETAYDVKALELFIERATKPFFGSDLEPIQLKPLSQCSDCSLPMKGISYGFYPFWQASAAYKNLGIQTINPATVDYSVFKRIAYFALPIEHDGSIKQLLHWKTKNNVKGFVQTLNKYNVKRDLVLYSNSWQSWGKGKSEADNDKNIKQIVHAYAEQHLQQIVNLHKQVEEWGGLSGITVYFDGYEKNSNSDNIISYLTYLNKKIAEDKSINFDVNLMLGIKWDKDSPHFCRAGNVSKRNETYFKELTQLFTNKTSEPESRSNFLKSLTDLFSADKKTSVSSSVSNLLVFLNEPVSKAKKCLRMQIENEFHGEHRIDALRKVIPILGRIELKESAGNEEFDETRSEFSQFSDDISYLKDNFGGIATWPIPMDKLTEEGSNEENKSSGPAPVTGQMSRFLKRNFDEPYKNYMDYSSLGLIGEFLYQPAISDYFSVCSVVCPNRSLFNYAFIFLFMTSLVSFVAFRVNCKARKFIIRMKWFDIALKFSTTMIFLSILGCDPDWQLSANFILISLVLFFIAYFIYRFFFCGYESHNEN
jgi:hypothetical protein